MITNSKAYSQQLDKNGACISWRTLYINCAKTCTQLQTDRQVLIQFIKADRELLFYCATEDDIKEEYDKLWKVLPMCLRWEIER